MTHDDGYLWDRSGAPDPFVATMERELAPLRLVPLDGAAWGTSRTARPHRGQRCGLLALAASLLLAGIVGGLQWRLSWPSGEAWPLRAGAGIGVPARLAVGEPLDVGPETMVTAKVARLGTLDILPATSLTLDATGRERHQLTLARGRIALRVWAPPGAVSIATPAGTVVDLGCAFELDVDDDEAEIRVRSGWVQAVNASGESLVPEGASTRMRAGRPPGVPIFDDAAASFAAAVRRIETASAEVDLAAEVGMVQQHARARDIVTLLTLAVRQPPGTHRAALATIAAALVPPPDDVALDAVAAGDNDAVWRWYDALPLPDPKGWWRHWRDGLSAFTRDRS